MGDGGGDADTLRRTAGLATPMALRGAVTLGLPDRLLGDGASVERLAAALDVSPVALDLLLGHLATIGVLDRIATGYRTTEFGANLCAGAGTGLNSILPHLDSAAHRAGAGLPRARPRRHNRPGGLPRAATGDTSGPTSPSTPTCASRSTSR